MSKTEYTPKSKSVFDNTNKLRHSWVSLVKGTTLNKDKETRFEIYKEMDEMVREEYKKNIQELHSEDSTVDLDECMAKAGQKVADHFRDLCETLNSRNDVELAEYTFGE